MLAMNNGLPAPHPKSQNISFSLGSARFNKGMKYGNNTSP